MLSLHVYLHSHLTFSLCTQLPRPPRLRKLVLHWLRELVLTPLLLPVLLVLLVPLVLLVLPALVLPTLVLPTLVPVAVLPMLMPLLSSRLLWYVFSIF